MTRPGLSGELDVQCQESLSEKGRGRAEREGHLKLEGETGSCGHKPRTRGATSPRRVKDGFSLEPREGMWPC